MSGIIYAIPIALLILIGLHIVSSFQIEKERIQEKSVILFKEAIKEDFQNRSKILTEKVTTLTIPPIQTTSDSSTFKSETTEIKVPALPNRSLDEKMTDFLQSVLAVENPIDVYKLDTIFQQKLKEKNIHLTTAICLTDTINKKNNNCTLLNTSSFTSLFSEPYLISSIGISLRAYIKIPPISLIKRMPVSYWITLAGGILFTLSIGYAWHNIRRKIPVFVKNSVKREHALQKELIQKKNELDIFKQQEAYKKNQNIHAFSSNLLFEKDTKTLRYEEEVIKLTYQQQLLLMVFCNAPENTCSVNDLSNLVWKDCTVEENTIHRAISRFNSTFKTQGLYIQYEFKDSYKLTFTGNSQPISNQS